MLMPAITDITFANRVLQAPGAVLVEFWKAGCAPCAAFAPELDAFAAARPDIAVATYEVVLNSPAHRTWKRHRIAVTPTVILFRDGEPIWRGEGQFSAQRLVDIVGQALDAPPTRGVA